MLDTAEVARLFAKDLTADSVHIPTALPGPKRKKLPWPALGYVQKYRSDQARDDHGRFASDASTGGETASRSAKLDSKVAQHVGEVTGAAGSFLGGAAGAAAGTAVAGTVGSVIGTLTGAAAGEFLGRQIGERVTYAAQGNSFADALARLQAGPQHEEAGVTHQIANLTGTVAGAFIGNRIGAARIAKGGDEFTIEIPIVKSDSLKQGLVYGWASIISKDGQTVTDHQGDQIEPDELVKAAHDFMSESRVGGSMHSQMNTGHVVESIVMTPEVQKALGVDLKKVGWFIAYQVTDPALKERVAKGDFRAFSIGGRGIRTPVE